MFNEIIQFNPTLSIDFESEAASLSFVTYNKKQTMSKCCNLTLYDIQYSKQAKKKKKSFYKLSTIKNKRLRTQNWIQAIETERDVSYYSESFAHWRGT